MNWEELEQKYHIRFKKESGNFRDINEWLDDVYLTLSRKGIINLMEDVFNSGNELFQDLVEQRKRF